VISVGPRHGLRRMMSYKCSVWHKLNGKGCWPKHNVFILIFCLDENITILSRTNIVFFITTYIPPNKNLLIPKHLWISLLSCYLTSRVSRVVVMKFDFRQQSWGLNVGISLDRQYLAHSGTVSHNTRYGTITCLSTTPSLRNAPAFWRRIVICGVLCGKISYKNLCVINYNIIYIIKTLLYYFYII